MTAHPQSPITLTVSNLASATSFYLSALHSLGYQYQSKVQHHTANSSSLAVGIGPSNTSRIDLFLSESGSAPRKGRRKPAHAHVVFPASSPTAVRDFYTASLNAGGRSVSPPELKDGGQGPFAATIQDLDGNKVEVCHIAEIAQNVAPRATQPSAAVAPPPRESIHNSREQVSDKPHDGPTNNHPSSRESPPAAPVTAHHNSASRGRRPPSDTAKTSSSVRGTSNGETPRKAVVGTLLGAAAGAAVVYAFTKETQDSKAKEAKFDSRRQGRERLEQEARQRAYALAWREKAAKSARQRGSPPVDRDSGYYSERREPSPDNLRYRAIAYPQGRRGSSLDGRDSRAASSRTLKALDQGPPLSSAPRQTSNAAGPQRSLSHRSRPPASHITVSQPPSELRRPSTPPQRFQNTSRTIRRYIPVSPPSPPGNPAPSYRSAREAPPPSSHRWDEYDYDEDDDDDGDGLDDETVVPDDSISVVSANAPSHKIDTRRERRRRRADVDVY